MPRPSARCSLVHAPSSLADSGQREKANRPPSAGQDNLMRGECCMVVDRARLTVSNHQLGCAPHFSAVSAGLQLSYMTSVTTRNTGVIHALTAQAHGSSAR
jgi:hypothetical protein